MVFYGTKRDFEIIRNWINAEPNIAWIIKAGQSDNVYIWRAVNEITDIADNHACAIWHTKSGSLNIPSGQPGVPDTIILDPFKGWSQTLENTKATQPWFGSNLPGPYSVRFSSEGKEKIDAIGRSEFCWQGDYFKSIGKPAHPEAKKWWQRLKRFISQNSETVPLMIGSVYVLPDAFDQYKLGCHLDVNP